MVPSNQRDPLNGFGRKTINPIFQGVLFLVFGLPGLFALFGGSFLFADFLFRGLLGKAVLLLIVTILGALGILVGVGKTQEPAYLVVFFSFPVTLFLTSSIWPGDKGMPILAAAVIAILSNFFVQRYYKRKRDLENRWNRNTMKAKEECEE